MVVWFLRLAYQGLARKCSKAPATSVFFFFLWVFPRDSSSGWKSYSQGQNHVLRKLRYLEQGAKKIKCLAGICPGKCTRYKYRPLSSFWPNNYSELNILKTNKRQEWSSVTWHRSPSMERGREVWTRNSYVLRATLGCFRLILPCYSYRSVNIWHVYLILKPTFQIQTVETASLTATEPAGYTLSSRQKGTPTHFTTQDIDDRIT